MVKKPKHSDTEEDDINKDYDDAVARKRAVEKALAQPSPSPLKRAALIAFTVLLFWLAFSMRTSLYRAKKEDHIIYANRFVLFPLLLLLSCHRR